MIGRMALFSTVLSLFGCGPPATAEWLVEGEIIEVRRREGIKRPQDRPPPKITEVVLSVERVARGSQPADDATWRRALASSKSRESDHYVFRKVGSPHLHVPDSGPIALVVDGAGAIREVRERP
ncbi:MAG: hypothetical protein EA397_15675 [Deltaproteobacteria bacterium]|nr:MAG: hypothetical protein EA397_15675 [Deltaproteobacteria bacterium]